MTLAQARRAKTEIKTKKSEDGGKVIAYHHKEKRRNNPDVGVVTPETDQHQPKTTRAYEPHPDPPLPCDLCRVQFARLLVDPLAHPYDAGMPTARVHTQRPALPPPNPPRHRHDHTP